MPAPSAVGNGSFAAVARLDAPPPTVPLLARAALQALPGVGALPGIGGRRAADLPDRELVLELAGTDRDRLARYDRVCGFTVRDRLPVTYPHVLAFPLQLRLVIEPSFPLAPIGLVHISNRIRQRRPLDAGEPLRLGVRVADLRPHRRGRQFDLITEVRAGGELVWEERSTNLRVELPAERDGSRAPEASAGAPEEEPLRRVARWRLRGDLGRRYGAISGDLNPIHMHPLSARLLGFRAAIVHGMWTKARCLAALEPLLPDSCEVEVEFKRPLLLPATVELWTRRGPTGWPLEFAVRSAGRGAGNGEPALHLQGRVAPA